jgi:hypothetical protein
MATSNKDKVTPPAPDEPPADELHGAELADADERPADAEPALAKSVEELSPDERANLSRYYRQLRTAQTPGDQEEARERIRALMGPAAEIGDHVVTLANGAQHRMEYAGATRHNGVPILSVYEDAL